MSPEDEKLNRKLSERLAARKRHFPTSELLCAAFERSRDALLAEARRHCVSAELINVGPDVDERSDWWSAIVKVDTDDTKRAFQSNDVLMRRLRNVADVGGFLARLARLAELREGWHFAVLSATSTSHGRSGSIRCRA